MEGLQDGQNKLKAQRIGLGSEQGRAKVRKSTKEAETRKKKEKKKGKKKKKRGFGWKVLWDEIGKLKQAR